jgi:hypothetical protein
MVVVILVLSVEEEEERLDIFDKAGFFITKLYQKYSETGASHCYSTKFSILI